jgi:hypothetical protein
MIDAQLDWAVAQVKKYNTTITNGNNGKPRIWLAAEHRIGKRGSKLYKPSSNWEQAGPIIEKTKIALWHNGYEWVARGRGSDELFRGATPLWAAMRCYVIRNLGHEIELPGELNESNDI